MDWASNRGLLSPTGHVASMENENGCPPAEGASQRSLTQTKLSSIKHRAVHPDRWVLFDEKNTDTFNLYGGSFKFHLSSCF